MGIANNIASLSRQLAVRNARLVAVSKTHPVDRILEAYQAGQRLFGENKVQELVEKQPHLPGDVEWHLIGHLQRNKVKYITPFVSLIHSVDSLRLLEEINRQGEKAGRIIPCLLQIFIASEETKFGLSPDEVRGLLRDQSIKGLAHVHVEGLMGMASMTDNLEQVREEFRGLKGFFEELRTSSLPPNVEMKELSMGMSADYAIAIEEGSTLVRIGTAVFGVRGSQENA